MQYCTLVQPKSSAACLAAAFGTSPATHPTPTPPIPTQPHPIHLSATHPPTTPYLRLSAASQVFKYPAIMLLRPGASSPCPSTREPCIQPQIRSRIG